MPSSRPTKSSVRNTTEKLASAAAVEATTMRTLRPPLSASQLHSRGAIRRMNCPSDISTAMRPADIPMDCR